MYMFEIVVGIIIFSIMLILLYVGLHISEEKRQGKSLPLIWEKEDRKTFDKARVEYREGDNT